MKTREFDLQRLAESCFARVDAALPTISRCMEALGDTDDALELALAKYTLEGMHSDLKRVWEGQL